MSETFQVDVKDIDGGVQVAVHGEVDVHTCQELDAVFDSAVADHQVVLDLSAVTFIDSSGLRSLLRLHNDLNDAGGSLVVQDPSPATRRLLDITGISDVFTQA